MSVVADRLGVSTLVGTPKEIQAQLARSQADHVLVVAFDHIKPSVFAALAENFTNVASSMFEVLLERQDRESLERLAENACAAQSAVAPAAEGSEPAGAGA
ncbi:hypothetical protein QGN06_04280 [Achromobacter xylosoxidans]|uniref:hypothetical protein n=1 Tax=Alcaligenes xylosoxydans xylosoxydans TaxID=85698 RepID=UPI0037A2E3D4